MIYIESKKKSLKRLHQTYPNAVIIDVTSKGGEPWVKVSPFYPHGGIPIPFSPEHFAMSVEGIWQGLKVFEMEDIDPTKFTNSSMKGIKRTFRKFGKPLGHRKGVEGTELLDYRTARYKIYLTAYAWVLDNKAQETIQLLKAQAEKNDLVMLDFDTNGDLENLRKPLSHAALVKLYLEKKYPHLKNLTFDTGVLHVELNEEKIKKPNDIKETPKKIKKTKSKSPGKKKTTKENPQQLTLL